MKHFPVRKTQRISSYDYSSTGSYFVTTCIKKRMCVLCAIDDEKTNLTDLGKMIEHWWQRIPTKFGKIVLDEYVIMPNHIHGIITMRSHQGRRTERNEGSCPSLPDIMRWFKTMTTNALFKGVHEGAWDPIEGGLWQRSYYDRIIRNDEELTRMREYIVMNPIKWALDEYYSD
jgi:putative transposase